MRLFIALFAVFLIGIATPGKAEKPSDLAAALTMLERGQALGDPWLLAGALNVLFTYDENMAEAPNPTGLENAEVLVSNLGEFVGLARWLARGNRELLTYIDKIGNSAGPNSGLLMLRLGANSQSAVTLDPIGAHRRELFVVGAAGANVGVTYSYSTGSETCEVARLSARSGCAGQAVTALIFSNLDPHPNLVLLGFR